MSLIKLFFVSFYLSSTTVGGGFVIISVIRRLFVEKYSLLTDDDMLDITSLAQSCPGAVAINASIVLGYKLRGIRGAAVSLLGTFIPPLIIMSVLSSLYSYIGDAEETRIFAGLLLGLKAGVAAVILDAAVTLSISALRGGKLLKYMIFVSALALQLILGLSAVYVILIALAVGVIDCIIGVKHGLS